MGISVSIIGGIGCGKTTALGLLHEALTSYALRNPGNFQFTPDLVSTTYMNRDILIPMKTGKFPSKTEVGSREEVKLLLRFKNTGFLAKWNELELNSYDISGEDLKQTLDEINSSKSMAQIIVDLTQRKTLVALLESEVFIFIIDSMSCDPSNDPYIAEKKVTNDLFLQQLWLAIKAYKNRVHKKAIKGIGLIFAKYDQAEKFVDLGPVDYYSLDNLDQSTILEKSSIKQNKPFDRVVHSYLPYTYTSMVYNNKDIQLQNMRYFRSGITMNYEEDAKKNFPIQIPLTFSADEYIRMAKWLSEIK